MHGIVEQIKLFNWNFVKYRTLALVANENSSLDLMKDLLSGEFGQQSSVLNTIDCFHHGICHKDNNTFYYIDPVGNKNYHYFIVTSILQSEKLSPVSNYDVVVYLHRVPNKNNLICNAIHEINELIQNIQDSDQNYIISMYDVRNILTIKPANEEEWCNFIEKIDDYTLDRSIRFDNFSWPGNEYMYMLTNMLATRKLVKNLSSIMNLFEDNMESGYGKKEFLIHLIYKLLNRSCLNSYKYIINDNQIF